MHDARKKQTKTYLVQENKKYITTYWKKETNNELTTTKQLKKCIKPTT